jgi:DHA2 family multidrug resistance protein
MCVGLSALQYVLEEGQRDDWFESKTIIVLTLVAVFTLIGFVIQELTTPVPAVNLSLFKDRVYASGTAIGAVMFAMLMANMFLLPIFMQESLGYTAMQSGFALMPRVAVMMMAVPIVGRLYNLVSTRLIVGVGVGFFCIGAYLMSHFNLNTSTAGIYTAVSVQGLGFACLFVPLTTVALTNIPRDKMTDATGMNSLLRQIGGSVGLALFATTLSRYITYSKASIGAHVVMTRPEVASRMQMMQGGMMSRGIDAVTSGVMSIGMMTGEVVQQAMVLAFDKIFLLAGFLFLLVLPLLAFLKTDPAAAGGEHIHVEME